jgi:hypothetical protein
MDSMNYGDMWSGLATFLSLPVENQIRLCVGLVALFASPDGEALPVREDRLIEWNKLIDAGIVTHSGSSLRLTNIGRQVVMELADHYIYAPPPEIIQSYKAV